MEGTLKFKILYNFIIQIKCRKKRKQLEINNWIQGEGADRNGLSDSATQSHFFEWFEDDSLPGSDPISEVIYKDLFYYPTKVSY